MIPVVSDLFDRQRAAPVRTKREPLTSWNFRCLILLRLTSHSVRPRFSLV